MLTPMGTPKVVAISRAMTQTESGSGIVIFSIFMFARFAFGAFAFAG